jgi:hypothetical protein
VTTPDADGFCRYRLHVIADTVTEVVTHIGGWLVDLSMAGWDVSVLLPHSVNDNPLRILGVEPGRSNTESGSTKPSPLPDVLAVSTASYISTPGVRAATLASQRRENCSVVLWGGMCPPELRRSFSAVEHHPSAAAAAFKAKALGAAADLLPANNLEALHTHHSTLGWMNPSECKPIWDSHEHRPRILHPSIPNRSP